MSVSNRRDFISCENQIDITGIFCCFVLSVLKDFTYWQILPITTDTFTSYHVMVMFKTLVYTIFISTKLGLYLWFQWTVYVYYHYREKYHFTGWISPSIFNMLKYYHNTIARLCFYHFRGIWINKSIYIIQYFTFNFENLINFFITIVDKNVY